MEDLTLLAILIIVFWIAAIGYYVYVSGKQKSLRDDLDELTSLLGEDEEREAG